MQCSLEPVVKGTLRICEHIFSELGAAREEIRFASSISTPYLLSEIGHTCNCLVFLEMQCWKGLRLSYNRCALHTHILQKFFQCNLLFTILSKSHYSFVNCSSSFSSGVFCLAVLVSTMHVPQNYSMSGKRGRKGQGRRSKASIGPSKKKRRVCDDVVIVKYAVAFNLINWLYCVSVIEGVLWPYYIPLSPKLVYTALWWIEVCPTLPAGIIWLWTHCGDA